MHDSRSVPRQVRHERIWDVVNWPSRLATVARELNRSCRACRGTRSSRSVPRQARHERVLDMIRRASLFAGMALLAVTPAAAHRGHASLAVVEIDAKSGAVIVTHRMAAHDVEPALAAIAPAAQPSLDDPDAVSALVAYIGQRFRIRGVTLAPAGQKLAGDTVELRYVGRLKGKPAQLLISGGLFGETWYDAGQHPPRRDHPQPEFQPRRPGQASGAAGRLTAPATPPLRPRHGHVTPTSRPPCALLPQPCHSSYAKRRNAPRRAVMHL